MNKKIVIFSIIFLIVGLIIGYLFKGGFFSFVRDTEKSFKTGGVEPRYLREFKRPPLRLPEDRSVLAGVTEKQTEEIEKSLNRSGEYAKTFSWFKEIQDEHVFLYVTDLGNLPFTIDIDRGEYSIRRGFDLSKAPTLLVPLEKLDVDGLELFLKDGELSYEEQYKIYRILTIPALQALYSTDVLYLPGDKTRLRFDDLVQLEIPPEKPVLYRGYPVTIEATAVNVDGQWLVFPGLQGDPDWKISLTLEKATQLYVMGIYEARQIGHNPLKLLGLSRKFLQFMSDSVVYIRPDHKR